MTMARQAVLTWLTAPARHRDAVAEGVRGSSALCPGEAVYDVLAVCARAGHLRRIQW